MVCHKASFTADEEILFRQPSAAEDKHSVDSSTSKRGSLACAVPSISSVDLFIVFQPLLGIFHLTIIKPFNKTDRTSQDSAKYMQMYAATSRVESV